MNILYEDKDIIVCVKEAGVPTQSDKTRDMDMVNLLRNYILQSKVGGIYVDGVPYIGLVHRLDRPVGGVMVFAKNPTALKNLNKQISLKSVNKSYLAMGGIKEKNKIELLKLNDKKICHESEFDESVYTPWINVQDYLYKDGKNNISKIVNDNHINGKKAELDFRIIEIHQADINSKKINICLMEIYLITGRHHQIRVQMSNQGFPLLGDMKYNKLFFENVGLDLKYKNIALYSYRLEFSHPKTKERMKFVSMPTEGWFILNKE